MEDTETQNYQVRRYRMGRYSTGLQVASGVTLEDAVKIVFRLTEMQEEYGGSGEYCILPE